jgi:hypothetical protein
VESTGSEAISTPSGGVAYLPLIQKQKTRSPSQLFIGPLQAGSALDADIADVATADVDRDGDLDLIAVYPMGPELAVCYNDGTGGFSQPWYVNEKAGTADLLQSVAAADLDGDGYPDLVSGAWNGFFGVSGDENTLAVNRNRGDGTFERAVLIPVSHPTEMVVTADFNLDGQPDIAVTYRDADSLAVLLNQGGGRFDPYRDYPTGQDLWSLSVADLNGDRYPDLIVVAVSGDEVLLTNRGDGTFIPAHLALPDGVQDVSGGDLDEDGDWDLVALNSISNTLTVLVNRGNGKFDVGDVISSTHWLNSIAVSDFDADHHLDLVVANYDDSTVSVYYGDGQGHFNRTREFFIGRQPHDILTADLDRDGSQDIVACGDGIWALGLLNRGDGSFETIDPPYEVRSNPRALEAVDLDNDGFDDLLVYHANNQGILVSLFNDGHGRFSLGQTVGVDPWWNGYDDRHPLVTGDFDGDGDADAVIVKSERQFSGGPPGFRIYHNDGHGQLVTSDSGDWEALPPPLNDYGLRINVLERSDLDRDGKLDIIAATSDGVMAFFNDGHGRFPDARLLLPSGSKILAVADLNGDHLDDIAVGDYGPPNRQLLVLMNQGNRSFAQAAPFNTILSSNYAGLAAGDLDSDGDLDLVLVYESGAFVPVKGQIFLNDGSGRFTTGSPLQFPGQSPNDVAIADIDLDGDLDVLATTSYNRVVTINFNDGAGRFDRRDPLLLTTIERPIGLAVADFDLDGDPDVATVNEKIPTSDPGTVVIRVNGSR